jgi:hypothetical protein
MQWPDVLEGVQLAVTALLEKLVGDTSMRTLLVLVATLKLLSRI